jgi:hypothetical protein
MRVRLSSGFIKELLNGANVLAIRNEGKVQASTGISVDIDLIHFRGIGFRRHEVLAVLNVLRPVDLKTT